MLNKLIVACLVLSLLLVGWNFSAYASSDIYDPILHEITVDKTNYVPGETIKIEAVVTDEGGSGR